MKHQLIVIPLLSLSFATFSAHGFEFCGLRVGDTPARAIARDTTLKGKNVQNQCLPFAVDLSKKLRAAGISAQVVGYRYGGMTAGARDYGQVRGHAVVVYEDGGRSYVMDNQSWVPRWVEKSSENQTAIQFEGMDSKIVSAWKVKEAKAVERRLTGRRKSLHRNHALSASSRMVTLRQEEGV